MDDNKLRNVARIDTLFVTIISCVAAPLVSHWLDVCIGTDNNRWSSERLMVLFFSAIAGNVIWDKILRCYQNSKLNKRGFNLNNAGAAEQLVWTMPSLMVLMFYNSVFGATMSIVFCAIALAILWKDKNEIRMTQLSYAVFGLYSIIVIIIDFIVPISVSLNTWLRVVPVIFVINVATWLFGELIEMKLRKKK